MRSPKGEVWHPAYIPEKTTAEGENTCTGGLGAGVSPITLRCRGAAGRATRFRRSRLPHERMRDCGGTGCPRPFVGHWPTSHYRSVSMSELSIMRSSRLVHYLVLSNFRNVVAANGRVTRRLASLPLGGDRGTPGSNEQGLQDPVDEAHSF